MQFLLGKTVLKAVAETSGILVVALVFMLFSKVFTGYSFKYDGSPYYRYYDIVVSCLPVIFLYGILRFLLSRMATSVFVSTLTALLGYANHVKSSMTGEPLSWTEISKTANLSVVTHYMSIPLVIAVITTAMLALALFARYEWPIMVVRFKARRNTYLAFAAILILASVVSYRGKNPADAVSYAGYHLFEALGAKYDAFEWPKNVKKNGLGVHLIHTSLRHMPGEPTVAERKRFDALIEQAGKPIERPKTVVMILCESCWHDDERFKSEFQPLIENGFTPFRGIAPTYGGGTVNSAFEMVTGLPARGEVLTGVIYQEYAPVISDQAYALPRYLQNEGFHTVAMHNNFGKFWYRDVVSPKLGYMEFHDIEDMGVKPTNEWEDDSTLFRSALRELDSNRGKQVFMHLTTVYTHGGYDRRDDLGEGHYREKLTKSIASMATFVDDIYARDPEALVLVYGDHKPTLTSYFLREGVFSDTFFHSIGIQDTDFQFSEDVPRSIVGDMPLWVRGSDSEKVKRFVEKANAVPFFCVATFLDEVFLMSGLPAFKFGRPICDGYADQGYEDTVARYPAWLFSESILR
jgi:phosphoglycerol transferase MdoB-like AlkP superfamily enzyme